MAADSRLDRRAEIVSVLPGGGARKGLSNVSVKELARLFHVKFWEYVVVRSGLFREGLSLNKYLYFLDFFRDPL